MVHPKNAWCCDRPGTLAYYTMVLGRLWAPACMLQQHADATCLGHCSLLNQAPMFARLLNILPLHVTQFAGRCCVPLLRHVASAACAALQRGPSGRGFRGGWRALRLRLHHRAGSGLNLCYVQACGHTPKLCSLQSLNGTMACCSESDALGLT